MAQAHCSDEEIQHVFTRFNQEKNSPTACKLIYSSYSWFKLMKCYYNSS